MKIFFSILMIHLFWFNVISQNSNLTIENNNTYKKVKKYYKNVNKAEKKIMKGKYDKASKFYIMAFKKKYPFYKDVRNALSAELMSDKRFNVILYLLKIKMSKFAYKQTKKEFINNLKNDTVYTSLPYFDLLLDSLKLSQNIKFYNKELKNALDSLIKKDQKFRISFNKKTDNFKKIEKTDSLNLLVLLNLYKQYGTISEDNAGLKYMNSVYAVLLHNSKKNKNQWFDKIKKEVLKGNFNNRIFADIIDNYIYEADKTIYGSRLCHQLYNKQVVILLTDNKIKKEINKRRNEIFLENYATAINKLLWQVKNKQKDNFSWNFYPLSSYIWVNENATENEIKKYLIEQEKIIGKIKTSNSKIRIYNLKK